MHSKTQTASKSPAHHTCKELADLVNTKHRTSSVSFGAKFGHLALEKGCESFKDFIFLLRKGLKGHQPYIHGKMF
jgi:hypothetical protein